MTTKEAITYVLEHDKNCNQYRLAKALGVTRGTVNHWKSGRNNMKATVYARFKVIYPSVEISDLRDDSHKLLGELNVDTTCKTKC